MVDASLKTLDFFIIVPLIQGDAKNRLKLLLSECDTRHYSFIFNPLLYSGGNSFAKGKS